MAIPPIKSVTFGIEVADLDASTKWYETLLGIAPESPDEGVIEFRLTQGTYLMLSAAESVRGADGSVNLEVTDVEEARRAVEALSLTAGPVQHIPDVLSYFEIEDPDGHTITFVQLAADA
jgi:catechol 2,3-dioxygenase-like lactoylglutathione lyase family enzyme